jgi:hypothetical protein
MVNDYHLIFNLNGVLVSIGDGQTRFRLVLLKLYLKEFLSTCIKNSPFTYGQLQ